VDSLLPYGQLLWITLTACSLSLTVFPDVSPRRHRICLGHIA
jgi:hypothetical protein